MKRVCGVSVVILFVLVLLLAKSSYIAKNENEVFRQKIEQSQLDALDAIAVELKNSSTLHLSNDEVYKLYYYSQMDPTEKYYKLAVNLLELNDPRFYARFSADERTRLADNLEKCEIMDDAEYREFLLKFAELVSEYWFNSPTEEQDAKGQTP